MIKFNDAYKLKLLLKYLLIYLQDYIKSYKDYESFKEGQINTENMDFNEIHKICHPNYYIMMNDTQFRTM